MKTFGIVFLLFALALSMESIPESLWLDIPRRPIFDKLQKIKLGWLVPNPKQKCLYWLDETEMNSKTELNKILMLIDKAIRQCQIVMEHRKEEQDREAIWKKKHLYSKPISPNTLPKSIWLNTMEMLGKCRKLSMCNKTWYEFCEKNKNDLLERYQRNKPLQIIKPISPPEYRWLDVVSYSLNVQKNTMILDYWKPSVPWSFTLESLDSFPVFFRFQNRAFALEKFEPASYWWDIEYGLDFFFKSVDFGSKKVLWIRYPGSCERAFVDGKKMDQIAIDFTKEIHALTFSRGEKLWLSVANFQPKDVKFDRKILLSLLNE